MFSGFIVATILMGQGAAPSLSVPHQSGDQKSEQKAPGPPTPWFDKDEDTFDLPADPKQLADLKHDVDEGKKEAAQVLKEERASTNMEYQERVERIGQQIAHIANHNHAIATWGDKRFSPYHYRYTVLKGDEINAFSLPGGYIFVYEGLMRFVESDDELAGILGHETAHAAFRHVATLQHNMNKALAYEIPALIASILAKSFEGAEGSQLLLQATMSGWSINAEKAADFGGFQFLEKSKYNPVAMLTFMERYEKHFRAIDSMIRNTIIQTHPITKERVQAMIDDLNQAHIPIERSKASPSFRVLLKENKDGTVAATLDQMKLYTFAGSDARSRAEVAAEELNHFFDATPELIQVTEDSQSHRILWKGQPLFAVTVEDAEAANSSQNRLLDKTVEVIKSSLYGLKYRVWDGPYD